MRGSRIISEGAGKMPAHFPGFCIPRLSPAARAPGRRGIEECNLRLLLAAYAPPLRIEVRGLRPPDDPLRVGDFVPLAPL